MALFGLFGKKAAPVTEETQQKPVLIQCQKCKEMVDREEAVKKKYICPKCGGYFRVNTVNRIHMVTDPRTFTPWFEQIPDSNPLENPEYPEKLQANREKTNLSEAVTVGEGKIFGDRAVIGVCDARFLMGSMGYAVGERITRAFEKATRLRLPVFIFCCSGGARMQEGIISLMQMGKTAAAIKRHLDAGLFYCSILTDPTMGGVTASFATLADVIMAEPGALIGFAGPRVIRQTIGQTLPEGFQTAEFLLEHGLIDGIVERKNLKKTMHFLIRSHRSEASYAGFLSEKKEGSSAETAAVQPETAAIGMQTDSRAFADGTENKVSEMTPWQKVRECRSSTRPSSMDYIKRIFDIFVEAHGDRLYGDDKALFGGIAFLDGQPVTILGEEKGTTMQERMEHNFGMPMPDGYRKAVRLMKQAEKFNRPIISFINTPGAFCGVDAEERGQGEAIARSIMEMSGLSVPVLCIFIGEGGSGGALATGMGNKVWMLENSTYAILSPEGYSSIVWKTNDRAEEAAEEMKLTAQDLERLRVIDKIIPEFGKASPETVDRISAYMKKEIKDFLCSYDGKEREEIAQERYYRFRSF
ncbi:MAG: acetyl-CoA carboxylase carboxyltransferase subunit alpha [Lachnospiraceae bacterium]|nr:acetyl-CoA carboxylase carboxyltransferase subunit alpha [Lachnospiraceae bacterium]